MFDIERFGEPDHKGNRVGNNPGNFDMWIVTRTPFHQDSRLQTVVNSEVIEGLISDSEGLAVFSGFVIEQDTIAFIATYSQRVREKRGLGEIAYRGYYIPEMSAYKGNYSSTTRGADGEFNLAPLHPRLNYSI